MGQAPDSPSSTPNPDTFGEELKRIGKESIGQIQEGGTNSQLINFRLSNPELSQEHVRMEAKNSYPQRAAAMGKLLATDEMRGEFEKLEHPWEGEINLLERLKEIPRIGAERARILEQLRKMAENGDKPGFKAMNFVANAVYELETVRDVLKDPRLSAIGENATGNGETLSALREEEKFLDTILTRLNVPHDEAFLARFDPYGSPRPDEKMQKLGKDAAMCGRVIAALACGAMVLLTGTMAYFANPNDPSFNATMVWVIPTALAVMGKDRLFGSEVDRLTLELRFMESPTFTSFIARHGNGLAKPMSNLLEQSGPATTAFNTLNSKTATPEQKTAAREELRTIMTGNDATSSQSLLITKLFEDEQSFVNFGRVVLGGAKTQVTKEIVRNYIERNRPPVVLPPRDLPSPSKNSAVA